MLGTLLNTQKSLQSEFPGLTEANFDYAMGINYLRENCPKGFTLNRTLEPHKKCNDEFWFETHDNDITLNSYQLYAPQTNYCIEFHQGCNNSHIISVHVKSFLLMTMIFQKYEEYRWTLCAAITHRIR